MALSIQALSTSTNGKSTLVAATTSVGTTVHTSVNNTTQVDRVWLYMHNMETASIVATVEWGETGSNVIKQTIPPQDGWTLVIPGLLIYSGSVVTVYAGAANKIICNAVVQRGP